MNSVKPANQRRRKTIKPEVRRHGIVLTEEDVHRLRALSQYCGSQAEAFQRLEEKLEEADILEPDQFPTHIVSMNSRFRLTDLDTGEQTVCMLVFPSSADTEHNRISVLGRLGLAVLGREVGETFEFDSQAGRKRYRVDEILYQPEAAGNYESAI